MSKWQKIETAPKDGIAILAWEGTDAGGQWPVVIKWKAYEEPDDQEEIGDGFWQYCEEILSDVYGECEPTHWMHLPVITQM